MRGKVVVLMVLVLALVVPVQAALVGHWAMNETDWSTEPVADDSGYGNDGGAVTGACVAIGAGINGSNAGSFNDDYVQAVKIPPSASLYSFTAKTLMVGFKASAQEWGTPYGWGYWNEPGDLLGLSINSATDATAELYLKTDAGGTALGGLTVAEDEWTLVGYTWDGTTVKYFVNGVKVGTGALTGTMTNTLEICFGQGKGGSWAYTGLLDEISIYNHALSETEVSDLYAATIPEPCTMVLFGLGGVVTLLKRREGSV